MYKKTWVAIFLVIFLSGCATARKSQDTQIQQLQNRIDYLGAELERKNQEISHLEDEFEKRQGATLNTSRQKDTGIAQISNRQIQIALKNAGFYQGAIDGKIGPKTKEAIKAFQKANGLNPDGIVGRRTWEKLSKHLN